MDRVDICNYNNVADMMRCTGIWHSEISTGRSLSSFGRGLHDRGDFLYVLNEKTIYHRIERYGVRTLNFSKISDDELDQHVTEAAKDFPFCGEQMLKFLHTERGIKQVSRTLRISDLRPLTLHCKLVSILII